MSQQIEEAFQLTYAQVVEHLLQEKGSKLERTVMVRNGCSGTRFKAINQIGSRTAQQLTSRHTPTAYTDTPHSSRWVVPHHYVDADLFDEEDDLESLIDPTNDYAMAQAEAIGRAKDAAIIDALDGDAVTGQDGTDTTAFDSSNQQVASGSTGLNTDKLEEAMQILLEANVDPTREEMFVLVAPKQHNEMLNQTKAISQDYMPAPVLQDGLIGRYAGFNFVLMNSLPKVGNDRYCFAYPKSAIRFCNWGPGIRARMDVMPNLNYSTQVHTKASFGAVRSEEGKVVRILCDES